VLSLFCGPTRLRDAVVEGNPVAAALSEHLIYLEATPVSQYAAASNDTAGVSILAMRSDPEALPPVWFASADRLFNIE
jgi:hypothetical protein